MNRLRAALALELTVEWRYRIPAVALVVTAVWTLVLLAMPAPLARGAGPVILTIDTATFGSFFIAALVLFERGEGALAALAVSPLRFGEYLGAKVAVLTGLSVASAVPIALAAGGDREPRPGRCWAWPCCRCCSSCSTSPSWSGSGR